MCSTLNRATFQLQKTDLLNTHRKKDIIKSSLFSALGSCSNHGTVVHITLKVQYNNPRGMANVEF